MLPDQPPLPTPMNLWFQPSAGIHTSILISESELGRMVAATRQKAGSWRNGFCCGLRFGRVKAPAATASALSMVVAGTESAAKSSQLAEKAAGTAMRNARIKVVDTGPPLDSVLRAGGIPKTPLAYARGSI